MTNHPNRNWRARMQASVDQWLTTTTARALIEIPMDRSVPRALTYRIREAYLAGYQDGKKELKMKLTK